MIDVVNSIGIVLVSQYSKKGDLIPLKILSAELEAYLKKIAYMISNGRVITEGTFSAFEILIEEAKTK